MLEKIILCIIAPYIMSLTEGEMVLANTSMKHHSAIESEASYILESGESRSLWNILSNQSNEVYEDWTQLIQIESHCVDFQLITLEMFLGTELSKAAIICRWGKSCPHYESGVVLDVKSQLGNPFPGPKGLETLIWHPRYRIKELTTNRRKLIQFCAAVQTVVKDVLSRAESYILSTVYHWSYMPNKFSFKIPVVVGDSSVFGDTKTIKHQIFYFILRKAINSYQSTSGWIFYSSPHIARHIPIRDKSMGDYVRLFPNILELKETQFLPSHYRYYSERRHRIPLVFLGMDTAAFVMEVDEVFSSRFPAIKIKDMRDVWGHQPNSKPILYISVPFLNLGGARATSILTRTHCQQNVHDSGICYHPCYPNGWIQPCHGGRFLMDSLQRAQGHFLESVRPAWYCSKTRQEMKLLRQRHLCENILGYNISDAFPSSRAKIKNCSLIQGIGDAAACRELIHRQLMKIELPSSKAARDSGFGSPNSIREVIDPLDKLLFRGAIGGDAVRAIQNATNAGRVISPDTSHNIHDNNATYYEIELSKIETASTALCIRKLGSTKRTIIKEHNECFMVAFLLELFLAFGAHLKTQVRFRIKDTILPGLSFITRESNPDFIYNVILPGPEHWKFLRTMK